jgi:transposase
MMGYQSAFQPKLFYHHVNLEQRVPSNHLLRKIKDTVDFGFIYKEVEGTYGDNGNVSVPPPVILKMMLLLVLYNVRSERELMATIPLRLDWLWFLGYDLDSEVPNYSVLSKARARWGVTAFKRFFEHIVWQCVKAGLVDGKKLFVDASLIDANASNNSVVHTHSLKRYLNEGYRRLEERLDEIEATKTTPANCCHISPTDPDASVTRQGSGKSKLRYKTHRAVDPRAEVITATALTPGSVNEGDLLTEMIDAHQEHTHKKVTTIVADSRYGTIENYLKCSDRGIAAHIPSLEQTQRDSGRKRGIFPTEDFTYDLETDTFSCPAGHALRRRNYSKSRHHYEYKANPEICASCELRDRCTRSKAGRSVKRHLRHDELTRMRTRATSKEAKRDITTRQHLSERSFAQSTRYGYKRARWRRRWRVEIQDFLICATQNIMVLIKESKERISKSSAQVGQAIRTLGAPGDHYPFISVIRQLLTQFAMAVI